MARSEWLVLVERRLITNSVLLLRCQPQTLPELDTAEQFANSKIYNSNGCQQSQEEGGEMVWSELSELCSFTKGGSIYPQHHQQMLTGLSSSL